MPSVDRLRVILALALALALAVAAPVGAQQTGFTRDSSYDVVRDRHVVAIRGTQILAPWEWEASPSMLTRTGLLPMWRCAPNSPCALLDTVTFRQTLALLSSDRATELARDGFGDELIRKLAGVLADPGVAWMTTAAGGVVRRGTLAPGCVRGRVTTTPMSEQRIEGAFSIRMVVDCVTVAPGLAAALRTAQGITVAYGPLAPISDQAGVAAVQSVTGR